MLLCLPTVRIQQEDDCQSQEKITPEPDRAGVLIWDFPASRNMRKKCLLFKRPCLWYFVKAAPPDLDRRQRPRSWGASPVHLWGCRAPTLLAGLRGRLCWRPWHCPGFSPLYQSHFMFHHQVMLFLYPKHHFRSIRLLPPPHCHLCLKPNLLMFGWNGLSLAGLPAAYLLSNFPKIPLLLRKNDWFPLTYQTSRLDFWVLCSQALLSSIKLSIPQRLHAGPQLNLLLTSHTHFYLGSCFFHFT